MKQYKSSCHTTSNEDGVEQIELYHAPGFWDWILRRDGKKESYVVAGTVWVKKGTGQIPNSDMQFELFECKSYMKRMTKLEEFFGRN